MAMLKKIDKEMWLLKQMKGSIKSSDVPNDMTIFIQMVRSHPFSDLRMRMIIKTLQKLNIETKDIEKEWNKKRKLYLSQNIPCRKKKLEKDMRELQKMLNSICSYVIDQIIDTVDKYLEIEKHSNPLVELIEKCWNGKDNKIYIRSEIFKEMENIFNENAEKIEPIFLN